MKVQIRRSVHESGNPKSQVCDLIVVTTDGPEPMQFEIWTKHDGALNIRLVGQELAIEPQQTNMLTLRPARR